MNNLYERIFSLCSENGIKPGKMCTDLGISRGNISDLKMGRIESLSADKLAKIATYFKVSVDYLLTGEETKKAPTQEGEREVTDREIKAAFFRGADMTDKEMDAAWEDVMDLRDIVIRKRKRDAGGK